MFASRRAQPHGGGGNGDPESPRARSLGRGRGDRSLQPPSSRRLLERLEHIARVIGLHELLAHVEPQRA